jgi:imidazolonepropionase-like amidohydrolase
LIEHQEIWAVVPSAIWDGNSLLSDKAVLIEGERISAVVDTLSLKNISKVELSNMTLLPGLVDSHVHLSDWMLPSFLAAGVTTVRDTGNNLEWVLKVRERTRIDPRSGPTIQCCGPTLDGSLVNWPKISLANSSRDEIVKNVQYLVAAGVDAIKLYVNLDKNLMASAVETAHGLSKYVLAHLGGVNALDASSIAVDEIEHLTGCIHHEHGGESPFSDSDYLDECVEQFLQNKTTMCPTLIVWDRLSRINESTFFYDKRLDWVHPHIRSAWSRFPHRNLEPELKMKRQESLITMKRALREISKRGCRVIIGTDTPWPYVIPGFAVHDELALIVESGVPPQDAIRMATNDAADVLGLTGEIGVIKPGAIANLMAVVGNPLEDISRISNVKFVTHRGHNIRLGHLTAIRNSEFQLELKDAISELIVGVADTKQLPKSPPVVFNNQPK